jgi:hypothetical protein
MGEADLISDKWRFFVVVKHLVRIGKTLHKRVPCASSFLSTNTTSTPHKHNGSGGDG